MRPTLAPQPHKLQVSFGYCLAAPRTAQAAPAPALHHPLPAMLEAVQSGGSLGAAARALGLSYRHVWGELRRWESDLGRSLVHKVQGQRATLTAFGERLLQAERQAQARFAAHIDALRAELEDAFASAYRDDH